jgi:hypothetical protein
MKQTTAGRAKPLWAALGLIAGLLVLAFWAVSSVAAQETPAATEQVTPLGTIQGTAIDLETPQAVQTPGVTPTPETNTDLRIEVVAEKQPVRKGKEFEAQVKVENVEHLAGFDFTISYDPKRLEPVEAQLSNPSTTESVVGVKALDVGQFLTTGERGQSMVCDDAKADLDAHTVTVSCVTTGPPLCLDGLAGASGSGVVGRVFFKSKGGGKTKLTLLDSTLALDDYSVCQAEVAGTAGILPNDCLPFRDAAGSSVELSCRPDGTQGAIAEGPVDLNGEAWLRLQDLGWAPVMYLQATGEVPTIPHGRVDAEVDLGKSGPPWLIIIIVVVVAAVGAGGAGYLWYRRRSAARAS